jgi:hypothetical protein
MENTYMDYLLSLLTFFMGLGIGHWLALGRDKRKEFNEQATDLYSKIYDYIEKDNDYFLPSIKELRMFISYVPFHKRWLFKMSLEKFSDSLQNDKNSKTFDPIKGTVTVHPEYVSQTKVLAHKLCNHLKRI